MLFGELMLQLCPELLYSLFFGGIIRVVTHIPADTGALLHCQLWTEFARQPSHPVSTSYIVCLRADKLWVQTYLWANMPAGANMPAVANMPAGHRCVPLLLVLDTG